MKQRINRRTRAAFVMLATAGAFAGTIATTGCATDPTVGYAAVSPFRADIRTIAVPMVDNDTFTRNVEFELTDALIKEIQSRTPYQVVDTARADTILNARIRRVELSQISKSPVTGLGEEVIVSMTIDFTWKDFRDESTLVQREEFAGSSLFVPSAPAGERIELGQFAVVQLLARDVVDTMQAAW